MPYPQRSIQEIMEMSGVKDPRMQQAMQRGERVMYPPRLVNDELATDKTLQALLRGQKIPLHSDPDTDELSFNENPVQQRGSITVNPGMRFEEGAAPPDPSERMNAMINQGMMGQWNGPNYMPTPVLAKVPEWGPSSRADITSSGLGMLTHPMAKLEPRTVHHNASWAYTPQGANDDQLALLDAFLKDVYGKGKRVGPSRAGTNPWSVQYLDDKGNDLTRVPVSVAKF